MGDIALPSSAVARLPRGERLLSDERLARLAGNGSSHAFAVLYERNHQAIYRYCRSILRHEQDAQDALQSAMTRAYAALSSQERDLAVRPWLFRIAHNEAISILRKRRPSTELSEDRERLDGDVESVVEARERLSTLVGDLQTLSERQRAALVMRELSGLSIEEIAGALGISEGAAKQTLFEARSSLHELAEGRSMQCENVREAISAGDRRTLRSKRIRAHLGACEECRVFRAAIDTRSADLRVLAPPLPGLAASTLLARVLAHGGGHGGGSAASSASLGGHAAASLLTKGATGVAVLAVAAAGTARLATHHRSRAPSSPAGRAIFEGPSQPKVATPQAKLSVKNTPHTSQRVALRARPRSVGTPGGASGGSVAVGGLPAALPGPAGTGGAGAQTTTHGRSPSAGGNPSHTGKQGRAHRHQNESQGSTGAKRAHRPSKSHGSGSHGAPSESHRETQSGAHKSPVQSPGTGSNETIQHGGGAGRVQGSNLVGASGASRAQEISQAQTHPGSESPTPR